MLKREILEKEYILAAAKRLRVDYILLEENIYSLFALELLRKNNIPFVLRGALALQLSLDSPKRLTTDIDIIVKPSCPIDRLLADISELAPFLFFDEEIRDRFKGIAKRHFRFYYKSAFSEKPKVIRLDVLFSAREYKTSVLIPSASFIDAFDEPFLPVTAFDMTELMADKLAAAVFLGMTWKDSGQAMGYKVYKQLFDCMTMLPYIRELSALRGICYHLVSSQIDVYGLSCSFRDIMKQLFRTCMCIVCRGSLDAKNYCCYIEGLKALQFSLTEKTGSVDDAAVTAAYIAYLVSCLLSDADTLDLSVAASEEDMRNIADIEQLYYLREYDERAFSLFVTAMNRLAVSDDPHRSCQRQMQKSVIEKTRLGSLNRPRLYGQHKSRLM